MYLVTKRRALDTGQFQQQPTEICAAASRWELVVKGYAAVYDPAAVNLPERRAKDSGGGVPAASLLLLFPLLFEQWTNPGIYGLKTQKENLTAKTLSRRGATSITSRAAPPDPGPCLLLRGGFVGGLVKKGMSPPHADVASLIAHTKHS